MNGIKGEEMLDIKPDPDASTPHADEDVFEDTGELQFPKTAQKTWLIRVPKDLWTGIERLKDDDTISLGNMYVWTMPDGSQKVGLFRTDGSNTDSQDPMATRQSHPRLQHDCEGIRSASHARRAQEHLHLLRKGPTRLPLKHNQHIRAAVSPAARRAP
jgi:hypothetical protein